jgi:hypothetical protein
MRADATHFARTSFDVLKFAAGANLTEIAQRDKQTQFSRQASLAENR